MSVGRTAGCAMGVAAALVLAAVAEGAEGAEVRVLTVPGTQPSSRVTLRAAPDVEIEDLTPGAQPASDRRGAASQGATFTGELTLFLPGFTVARAASIEVGDALVSAVRLFPETTGTKVVVFVRQPVTYTVAQPSPLGEIDVTLRGRARPVSVTVTRRGKARIVRPKVEGEPEVAIDAEFLTYDQQTNTLSARGDVTVTRADTILTADEVVYDRTNGIAEARGNVVLSDPQAALSGEFARLNLEDETGFLDSSSATLLPSGYEVEAERIEKRGGPCYTVSGGTFTTCRCGGLDRPSWSIGAGETDVRVGGFGLAKDATFRVKDVPVLWLPYFPFPANTNRHSGFLIPRAGISNRRGIQYEQPYFWAIDKSSDATVVLDVETSERLGLIGQYRYLLSRQARGQFTAAYYNERIRGQPEGTTNTGLPPTDVPENRFAVAGTHNQPVWGKGRFFLDMFAVGDDQFLTDINSFAFSPRDSIVLRSSRFTTNTAGFFKSWGKGFARLDNTYYQDLIDPQSLVLQPLPRIEVDHAVPFLGDRVIGRLNAQAVYYGRETGYDALRGDLAPELTLPFHFGRVLNASVTGQLRETAYYLTSEEQVATVQPDPGIFAPEPMRTAPELPRLATTRTRELGQVHARLGTAIGRVFDFPYLGLAKVKHTIEPEVQYLYVPQVDPERSQVELPACGPGLTPGVNCGATLFSGGYLFDERDAINRRNFFSYGLTMRLLGRPPGTQAVAPDVLEEATAEEGEETEDGDQGEFVPQVDPETLPIGLSANAVPGLALARGRAPVTASMAGPPRELMRFSVLQGYDVSRELVETSHLSDTDFDLRFNPASTLGLVYTTTVNLQEQILRGFTTGLYATEPGWIPRAGGLQNPMSLGLSYRFIEERQPSGPDVTPEELLLSTSELNEVGGSVYLRLGDYIGLAFLARYDLKNSILGDGVEVGPHFIDRSYVLRVMSRCNCWLVEAGVSDQFDTDELTFRLQLTLVGLGSFGESSLGGRSANVVGPLGALGLQSPGTGL